MPKPQGVLIVAKDTRGYICLWRDHDSTIRIPDEDQILFRVYGSFDDPDTKERALAKARKHGVPESKITDVLG